MHKNILLSLLFLAFCATGLNAQFNVVRETERTMSFGTRPCFRMEFANTEASTVETIWRDFAKRNFGAKLKKDKRSGEWAATKLRSGIMGDNDFAIYSTIEKNDNGSALNVWFDAGSYFLSRRENSGRAEEVARTLRECYYDVRRAAIQKEQKDQEAKMKDLEAKQKKLQRDNETLRKDIEAWKAKIKKAEEDIVTNERAQETNLTDQEAQRRLLEEIARRLENVENEGNN
jgi:hypothetical protein